MQYVLFHGTDAKAAASIIEHGLNVSTSGFGQTMLVGAGFQEDRREAARYRGERGYAQLVLAFRVEIVNPYVITDFEQWDTLRAEHMRHLQTNDPSAWNLAVDDPNYWTKYLKRLGHDAAVIPSTLGHGGGREWIVFDPTKAELVAASPAH